MKTECDEPEKTTEQQPQEKKRPTIRTILVEHPDLKAVAEAAKRRMIEEGYEAEEAESRINSVWAKFKAREYRYQQNDAYHQLNSPLDYLAGALMSMAKYERRYVSQEEHRKACYRDCEILAKLRRKVNWLAPESKFNLEADCILGQMQEANNRIREYLDTYKD